MSAPTFTLACPLPLPSRAFVEMGHGGGGRLSRELVSEVFRSVFENPLLGQNHDSAVFTSPGQRLAMTTDGYVVKPIFFPGGDIGKLAACGTLNDLAMAGARPLALSASFILEEGLPTADLQRIVASLGAVLREAGVPLATGDTKVVDRGRCEGVYITTTGIGVVPQGRTIAPAEIAPGDLILVSGDLGRHGIAILSAREGFELGQVPETDCAHLGPLVDAMLAAGTVHCLRDLTRGGLAAALCELSLDRRLGLRLDETQVPVCEPVRGAAELLGLDPLHIANEGRLCAFVPEADAERVLQAMRAHPLGGGACVVGRVEHEAGYVVAKNAFGTERIIDLPSGELLPRIC